ncbi:aminotransferase class V-fold PLP-dependent enzyme [Undibacterium terreum]|uniref:cysteine desulfurase n=1 Tax=Undibacterium terreum TaxID=1224302 RepID=A0A916XKC1_9BURK|nr:aminotransferase class V-fold PLP-dependent enzyme [Undibacterium terreum]GGC81045.1 hypothetical protein GCM10011396_30320 [Undibacterium terreum]
MSEIYLDHNATTPALPQAVEAACKSMASGFGNPSSTHTTGLRAKAQLDEARQRAKRLIGAGEGQVVFTSGATEGIQIAVLSALAELRLRRFAPNPPGSLLLYGATEHKAVSEALKHWNQFLGLGCRVVAIPVDGNGRHDLDFLKKHAADAAMICTMAVNNETGAISDLAGIEKTLLDSASQALWLVDAVQALGKIKLDLANTRIDYATFSGHKLYAPKGIGMLYARAGAPYTPLTVGGGQEFALRSGTENTAGIAALNAVMALMENKDPVFHGHDTLHGFRKRLVAALSAAFPEIVFNSPLDFSVPTTLNFSVPGIGSKELLNLFDSAGIRVSSGSACSSSSSAPSYVLQAMKIRDDYASSAIRMSFGPATTENEITEAVARIALCAEATRQAGGSTDVLASIQDGLLRLESDGVCCWVLTDAAARRCVIIDPVNELNDRLARYVHLHGLQLTAVLVTDLHSPAAEARDALTALLSVQTSGLSDARTDAHGWPLTGTSVQQGETLAFGDQVLACLRASDNARIFLAGKAIAEKLNPEQVQYAFMGKTASTLADKPAVLEMLAATCNQHTILCPGDAQTMLFTTLAAERAVQAPAGNIVNDIHIHAETIRNLLHDRPDTLLVDVREAYEHSFLDAELFDAPVLNVPLAQLASRAGEWLLHTDTPLIFFCRSGARSDAATRCMRRLGYQQVWSCAGGLT